MVTETERIMLELELIDSKQQLLLLKVLHHGKEKMSEEMVCKTTATLPITNDVCVSVMCR